MPTDTNAKPALIGIDIGGTKITITAYDISSGKIMVTEVPLWEKAGVATQLELNALKDQLQGLLIEAQTALAEKNFKIVGVGAGIPGRFGPDMIILNGTAPQLGEPKGVQFNGVNIGNFLNEVVAGVPGLENAVTGIKNDAATGLDGLITSIFSKGFDFKMKDQDGLALGKVGLMNSKVGFFTISTGLGSCDGKVDKNGKVTSLTDGHTSKAWLAIDEQDAGIIEHAIVTGKEMMHQRTTAGLQVKSEDVTSANGVARMAGKNQAKELDPENAIDVAAVKLGGKYLARLIDAIKNKQIVDSTPAQQWNEKYIEEASEIDIFFLSEGIMKDPKLGPVYFEACAAELRALKSTASIFHVTEPAPATQAAASVVLSQVPSRGAAQAA